MIYDLINMSDKITFRAHDPKTAAIVTIVLGNGRYAADPVVAEEGDEGGHESVPILVIGDGHAWWNERFPEDIIKAPYINAVKVVPALRSVCHGDVKDRRIYDEVLSRVHVQAGRAAFVANWNEIHRTSMNDIMGHAHTIADKLERECLT